MRKVLSILRHSGESRNPAAHVYAPYDSYARYRSRWMPIFIGMTLLVLMAAQSSFAADSSDNLSSMHRSGPHKPDPMLNTNMPAPPSAISAASVTSTDPKIDPRACEMLVKHTPSADVAYQPGVDANGNKVAPADLPNQPQMQLPSKIDIPLTISLAKVLNLDTTQPPFNTLGPGTEAVLGSLTVEGDKVTFNGKPLSDAEQDNLAVLCMKQNPK